MQVLGDLHWIGQVNSESQLDTLGAQTISYFSNAIIITFGHGVNARYKFQFKLYDNGSIDIRNTTQGNNAWKEWKTMFQR